MYTYRNTQLSKTHPVMPSTVSSMGRTWTLFPYFTSGNAVTLLGGGRREGERWNWYIYYTSSQSGDTKYTVCLCGAHVHLRVEADTSQAVHTCIQQKWRDGKILTHYATPCQLISWHSWDIRNKSLSTLHPWATLVKGECSSNKRFTAPSSLG